MKPPKCGVCKGRHWLTEPHQLAGMPLAQSRGVARTTTVPGTLSWVGKELSARLTAKGGQIDSKVPQIDGKGLAPKSGAAVIADALTAREGRLTADWVGSITLRELQRLRASEFAGKLANGPILVLADGEPICKVGALD